MPDYERTRSTPDDTFIRLRSSEDILELFPHYSYDFEQTSEPTIITDAISKPSITRHEHRERICFCKSAKNYLE